MATIRELQAKFTASTKGMRAAVKGVVDDLKSVKKESEDLNKTTKKTADDSKGAYRTMADGTKVYKDSMGKLRDEMGRFVQEQDTILQNASRSQKFFDNLGNSAITAGNKIKGVSGQLNTVGNVAKDFGGTLTKYVTLPVAGLAGLLGGTALSKGFSRLLDIDTAQAKLKGLGHDAENVETIMNSATDSVKGTAFGLGEAATTAANAVAAGIEPGEELTRYLTLTGDAAAIAGTDMNEMGSIFNKVQTNNKIQAEEMNQLLDRGVPIIKLLADQMGVAESEVRDLAASGEISAADFLAAVDKGFGGAAKIMGETSLSAAIDNMWASVGRIGANFLDAGGEAGGFFSQMKPLIGELTEWFSSMESSAADWGVKFGESFTKAIEWIRDFIAQIKALDDWQKKLIGWGAAIAVALGPILTILGSVAIFISKVGLALAPLVTGFGKVSKAVADAGGLMVWLRGGLAALAKRFSFLLGPVGIAIGIILTLGTAFMTAYKKSETFRNFIDGLKDKFMVAWEGAMEFKDKVVEAITAVTAMFKGDWLEGITILQKLGLSEEQILGVQNAVLKVRRFFHDMKEGVNDILSEVGDFFKSVFEDIKAWWDADGAMIFAAMETFITNVFEGIKVVVGVALDLVKDLFERFAPIVKGIWGVLWPTMQYLVETVWEKIKLAIGVAMDLIQGIISGVAALIEGDWTRFGEIISETASSIWTRVVEFFTGMKDNALQLFNDLTGGAGDKFIELRDSIIEKVLSLVERAVWEWERFKVLTEIKIRTMVASVKQFFVDLYENVTTKVTELKDGVVNKFTELKDGAVGKFTEMKDGVTGKFGEIHTAITSKVTETKDSVVGKFTEIKDGSIQKVTEMTAPIIAPFVSIYEGAKLRMEQLSGILSFIFERIKTVVVTAVRTTATRVATWFTNMYTNVSAIASNLRDRAVAIFVNVRDRVVATVTNLKDRAVAIFTNIRDRTVAIFTNVRDRVVSIATNLRDRAVSIFINVKDRVVGVVTNLRDRAASIFSNLRDRVTALASNLRDRVVAIFNNVRDRIASTISNARDRAVSIFSNLRDRVVSTASNLWDRVSSFFSNIYNTIRDKMRSAKDAAVGFATDLYDGAKAQFENLSSAASDMMDKIGQWIDDKKEAVIGKAKSLGIGIANAAIGGFNKMIGGINNVADLLGYDGDLISEIPTYSTGTNYHPGGPAIVGDKGPGNSSGGGSSTREIVELPNGKRFLADGNLLINLPRGSKVKKNQDTEDELSGGSGSNVFSRTAKSIGNFAKNTTEKAVTGVKNVAGKVADTADAVWEYAKDPGKLLDDIIGNISFDLPTKALEFAQLGLGKMKSVATDYIKGLFEGAEGAGDGSHILGKQIYQRFGRYTGGLSFNGGRHYGLDTAHKHEPLLSPVNGVVSRVWNDYGGGNSLEVNAGKYTWWFMHLSKVLASLGDRITAGQKIAVTGATGRFLSGTGHLHTQVMEGGVGNSYAIDPLPILKNLQGAGSAAKGIASKIGGYFRGGITSGIPELAWLNEEGFRESIISHNPAHKERSESIWQTTGNKLGFNDNSEETRLLRQQNDLLIALIGVNEDHKNVSEAILRKPGISDSDIVEAYDKKTYDDDLIQRIYKGRKK